MKNNVIPFRQSSNDDLEDVLSIIEKRHHENRISYLTVVALIDGRMVNWKFEPRPHHKTLAL